jgi:hypothetical protein
MLWDECWLGVACSSQSVEQATANAGILHFVQDDDVAPVQNDDFLFASGSRCGLDGPLSSGGEDGGTAFADAYAGMPGGFAGAAEDDFVTVGEKGAGFARREG